MKSKAVYIFAAAAVVLLGGYLAFGRPSQKAQAPTTPAENNFSQSKQPNAAGQSRPNAQTPGVENQTPAPAAKNSASNGASTSASVTGHFSTEGDITAPDVMVVKIDYDGSKFTPSGVNIKTGDIVVFSNKGANAFWPASAPHPVHTDYPAFDAKGAVPPGQTYEFKFTQAGNWKFHDHLNPSAGGVVNVSAK